MATDRSEGRIRKQVSVSDVDPYVVNLYTPVIVTNRNDRNKTRLRKIPASFSPYNFHAEPFGRDLINNQFITYRHRQDNHHQQQLTMHHSNDNQYQQHNYQSMNPRMPYEGTQSSSRKRTAVIHSEVSSLSLTKELQTITKRVEALMMTPTSPVCVLNDCNDQTNNIRPTVLSNSSRVSQPETETTSSESPTLSVSDPLLMKKDDGKLHRPPCFRNIVDKAIVVRIILICFTSGLICSIVGFVSLKDPSFINDHLPFRVFYPTGTLLMLTIVFLKLPKTSLKSYRLKYTALITLFILPVIITSLILQFDTNSHYSELMSYHDSPSPSILSNPSLSPLVFVSMILFVLQLTLSFVYVSFCMQDVKYL